MEKINYIIWDRQEKKFAKFVEHHYNEEQKREYFKIEGCNLWLEYSCALDVFTLGEKGELTPLNKYKLKKSWLEFEDVSNPNNKTKDFNVHNKETCDNLGHIKWNCGWRQYVFTDEDLILAEGCLFELFEKIKYLRLEREKNV